MLENLRFHDGEISNCPDFSRQLSFHGDVFINDAFGTAHRSHASTAIVPIFFAKNKYFGFLLANEINALKKALKSPKRPFTAIIGGLFILETVSVIIQVVSFKLTGKRVFMMAPLNHHFEKKGWAESTIVIRFWIISIILALIGLATLKLR